MKKTPDGRRVFVDIRDADDQSVVVVVQAGAAEKRCWVYGYDTYLTAKRARKLAKGLAEFAEWAEKT